MSSRRQFLGTLGKALGAGGLLLPLQGKGALAFADPKAAACLPVAPVAMPWSADRLELQRLKQAMLENRIAGMRGQGGTYEQSSQSWRLLMHDYAHVADTIAARPNPTWRDACELAEILWHLEHKEYDHGPDEGMFTGKLSRQTSAHSHYPPHAWQRNVTIALIEAVIALGGGERFDPREACWEQEDQA